MTRTEKTIELEANQPEETNGLLCSGTNRDFLISYWYDDKQEMPLCEQEHVIAMIEEGYTGGELNDDGNCGWWDIVKR